MLSPYEKLTRSVQNGDIEITFVYGTARSGTTICEKGIGQLGFTMVNEPFIVAMKKDGLHGRKKNFTQGHFESACGSILKECSKTSDGKKINKVVVKDISGVLPSKHFTEWMGLISRTIITYRDPFTQFLSFAKARYTRIYGRKVSLLSSFLSKDLPILEELQHPDRDGTILDKNRTRWIALARDLSEIRNMSPNLANPLLVETTLMRFNPRRTWQGIVRHLRLEERPSLELLAKPWTTNPTPLEGKHHQYQLRALESPGILPLDPKERLDTRLIPQKSSAHINGLMATYLRFLKSDNNAYIPTESEVNFDTAFGHNSAGLKDLQPHLVHILGQYYDDLTRGFVGPIRKVRAGHGLPHLSSILTNE